MSLTCQIQWFISSSKQKTLLVHFKQRCFQLSYFASPSQIGTGYFKLELAIFACSMHQTASGHCLVRPKQWVTLTLPCLSPLLKSLSLGITSVLLFKANTHHLTLITGIITQAQLMWMSEPFGSRPFLPALSRLSGRSCQRSHIHVTVWDSTAESSWLALRRAQARDQASVAGELTGDRRFALIRWGMTRLTLSVRDRQCKKEAVCILSLPMGWVCYMMRKEMWKCEGFFCPGDKGWLLERKSEWKKRGTEKEWNLIAVNQ